MGNNKYITVGELLGELKDHPMLEDLTLERVITYAIEFCRKWGANILFEEKHIALTADEYRVILPCDFYELISIRDHNTGLNYRYSTNIYHNASGEYDVVYDNEIFNNIQNISAERLTYKLNGNVLFLSTRDNAIDIAYQAIASDDDGYPLILDDATYLQALKDYIKLKRFEIYFDLGKIQSPVLQNAQQQYSFSARVLKNHFAMITPDQAQSVANALNNMIIHRTHHSGFITLGENRPVKNI